MLHKCPKTFDSAKEASEYYDAPYNSVKKACNSDLARCTVKDVAFLYEEDYKDVVVDEIYINIKIAFIERMIFGK